MAKKKSAPKTQEEPFEVVMRSLMEGASGFDVVAFVRASLNYMGHRTGKDPMEALASELWGMYYEQGIPWTVRVRIMEAFLRCLSKIPDGKEIEMSLPNMTDEQLEQARKELAMSVAAYATRNDTSGMEEPDGAA